MPIDELEGYIDDVIVINCYKHIRYEPISSDEKMNNIHITGVYTYLFIF